MPCLPAGAELPLDREHRRRGQLADCDEHQPHPEDLRGRGRCGGEDPPAEELFRAGRGAAGGFRDRRPDAVGPGRLPGFRRPLPDERAVTCPGGGSAAPQPALPDLFRQLLLRPGGSEGHAVLLQAGGQRQRRRGLQTRRQDGPRHRRHVHAGTGGDGARAAPVPVPRRLLGALRRPSRRSVFSAR